MPSLEEEIQQSRFPNEIIKANINLLYTANWLYNKISAHLKPFGLTHEQFNVLRILRGAVDKPLCQKDILSRMIAPNSNLTLILKRLKLKDLVKIEPSEIDRREYEITITDAGKALLKQIDQTLKPNDPGISNLNESEAFHLNHLLNKLRG